LWIWTSESLIMRKLVPVLIIAVLAVGGFTLYHWNSGSQRGGPGGDSGGGRSAGGPGFGPGGGGFRPPMTVALATVSRAPLAEYVTIVGNLIGAATVQVVPKVNGRVQSIAVRLADPVRKGQRIAKIEDSEIAQQVKQAQASFEVAGATVRQREADLKFASTSLDRARSLYERQLQPKQALDDAESRYQAAAAQLDLAHAQYSQAKARLEELQITLANTDILSPVDGFVGKRFLDPGAFASQNSPIVSVVDIGFVRLVVNLVEKDVKRVTPGTPALVEVDAFPGEKFSGHVSRIAPVFDPATRTAEMEVEVPNPGFQLKPGMYARVQLKVAERADALTVPTNALVFRDGQQGVFVPQEDVAHFIPIETGLQDTERVEVLSGLDEHATVISTGSAALVEGSKFVLADQAADPADAAADRSGGAAPAGGSRGGRSGGRRGGGPGPGNPSEPQL
jgi:RND family efflux transporter MFP subunit